MSEWQPIETAPKDGTKILASLVDYDGIPCGVDCIRWHEAWGVWVLGGCLIKIQGTGDKTDDTAPTHWLPLPEPPK